VTDDPTPASPRGEEPQIPPRRRARGGRAPRHGALLRGAPSSTPAGFVLPTGALILIMGVVFALAVLGIVFPEFFSHQAPGKQDVLFEREATARGRSAAEIGRADTEAKAFAVSLFGPELWQVKDHGDFAEEPAWQRVVETMGKQDPKLVVDHLDFSLNLHYEEVMQDPAAFRGRFVRMRGLVAGNFMASKLDKPIAGRGDVFRGLIMDPEGNQPVFFDLLDRPPPFRKMYDAVDVDGVFYRVVKYETKRGKIVEVPWIVARTVVKCQPDEESGGVSSSKLAVGALAAFLALVIFIVYLVRRGSRQRMVPGTAPVPGMSPAGFRRMFDAKLREERRPEPPPPPDSGA
jgi:hypothetical protein